MRRTCSVALAICAFALLAAEDDQPEKRPVGGGSARAARLIPVELPLRGTSDVQLKRMVQQSVEALATVDGSRPVLVLEFRTQSDQTSSGTEYERALALARYLVSDRLQGVRTVAYLPQSVTGHAVLPVLACEEIIMAAEAELGDAGLGEPQIDDSMRTSYREIAERRRTIPAAVALGMLDKSLTVSRVQTLDGPRFVLGDELQELQAAGVVTSVDSVVAAGDMARFKGSALRLEYGFASHLANDRRELLTALDLPANALELDPAYVGKWRSIRVDVKGPINAKLVNWLIRTTQDQLRSPTEGANFLCVVIDSPGGSLIDSLRLADFLAGLDATQVRTVAYVPSQARGDAAMIAWACQQLVMADDALLGGPGAANVGRREATELQQALRSLAGDLQRDWSPPVALVNPEVTIHRYSNNLGETRLFTAEELAEQPDPGVWKRGEVVSLERGLSGQQAVTLGVAQHTADSLAELQRIYHVDEELAGIQPNWAHLAIERLASPQIAGTLLFIAWFALIIEMSQPGLGAGGFVSALCFLLFFWSNFLNGTAAWLEGLLFVAGVTSLLVEIFVLPGFGIFGIGGVCLVVASLVLASQTFIIPRNTYQFERFTTSLMIVAAGLIGAFASLVLMRKYLPDSPVFNRLMLRQPDDEALSDRELLVDYRHLMGQRGEAITQLTPSGKARFGDEDVDVISDGELVSRGSAVVVDEVRGNHVRVHLVEEGKG